MTALVASIYILGLIIGYLIILWMIAKRHIDDSESDLSIARAILFLWPISIPCIIGIFLIGFPIFLVADPLGNLRARIIAYFRGNDKK